MVVENRTISVTPEKVLGFNPVGCLITGVRFMTDAELADRAWEERCLVLEIERSVMLYPSRDEEGNGPGEFFVERIPGKEEGKEDGS